DALPRPKQYQEGLAACVGVGGRNAGCYGGEGRILALTEHVQKNPIQFATAGPCKLQEPALQCHEQRLQHIWSDRCPAVQVPEPSVAQLPSRRLAREGERDLEWLIDVVNEGCEIGMASRYVVRAELD